MTGSVLSTSQHALGLRQRSLPWTAFILPAIVRYIVFLVVVILVCWSFPSAVSFCSCQQKMFRENQRKTQENDNNKKELPPKRLPTIVLLLEGATATSTTSSVLPNSCYFLKQSYFIVHYIIITPAGASELLDYYTLFLSLSILSL